MDIVRPENIGVNSIASLVKSADMNKFIGIVKNRIKVNMAYNSEEVLRDYNKVVNYFRNSGNGTALEDLYRSHGINIEERKPSTKEFNNYNVVVSVLHNIVDERYKRIA